MTTWAEFHPLKSCVIGTLPNAEDIIPYTELQNRYKDYFIEIINQSKAELDNLTKVLKDFGVDQVEIIANLYFKDIIETTEKLDIEKTIIGLSLDLSHSPKSKELLQKYK